MQLFPRARIFRAADEFRLGERALRVEFCGLRFAVCGLGFAVCGLGFAVWGLWIGTLLHSSRQLELNLRRGLVMQQMNEITRHVALLLQPLAKA